MKYPKISIVTPSFNQGLYIDETIKSIISQGGDFYIEYIIMDGGSTDNSVEIIKKYDRLIRDGEWPIQCSGIHYKWVSEKDNGQADAINKGFALCTGEIINWINSDDRLKPGALSSVIKSVLTQPDAGAWVGGCDWVNSRGKRLRTIKPRGLVRDKIAAWGEHAGYFYQPSCFLSTKAWERCGPLDKSFYTAFDLDLFIKIITNFHIYGVDTVWTEATIHKDAKTQLRIPLMRAERYIVQARHGFEELAIKNIERAETLAMKIEKYSKVYTKLRKFGTKTLLKTVDKLRK